MKKKFFAAALTCAVMVVSLIPSAFAGEGDATVNVTGGSLGSPSASGGYATGLYFNTTVADTTQLSAKSSSGTGINAGTELAYASNDYLQVTVTNGSTAWNLKATGAIWTDAAATGGATATLGTTAGTALSGKVTVRLDGTTASGATERSSNLISTVGSGSACALASGSATPTSINLTTSAQNLYTFSDADADACTSYVYRFFQPVDFTPREGGYTAISDPTSTITFTTVDG